MSDQLLRLSEIWAETNQRSEARLSTRVANDGGLIARLRKGGRLTTETFEKFLTFFRDGTNWPDGRLPQEAADVLENFENIATEAAASTGQMGAMSRHPAQDEAA